MDKILPKAPAESWVNNFFCESLVAAPSYSIDIVPDVKVKLDQNESPWDWPIELKNKILDRVRNKSWNRYPDPFAGELHSLVGDYVGLPKACVLTGPGSNLLIALIFDVMGSRIKGKMVIARPSFALFELHCKYAGIKHESWLLTDDFGFDLNRMPTLPSNSMVVFASPNNPTGSALPIADFRQLLKDNPETLFIADEAYYEFSDQPYTELLGEAANLIIIRTFSKTMGAAGLRLGYILGAPEFIEQLTKPRLPYLLNHFAVEAAMVMLSDSAVKEFVRKNIENACSERARVFHELNQIAEQGRFKVIPSQANFLLLKWKVPTQASLVYRKLIEYGVLVRDISQGAGLEGCLRVTMGSGAENDCFVTAINDIIMKSYK